MVSEQKTAWIIGGSGEIGCATALQLAETGVRIAVGYHAHPEEAQLIVTDIERLGVAAIAVRSDMTCSQSMSAAYQEITDRLSKPLIIIHAAGDSRYGLIQDMSDDDYNYLFDLYVKGSFHLVQLVLPHLISMRWGRLIFVSSIWGETGAATEVLYSAAKSAQLGLMKGLAKELAPSGITVNAIAPGAIATKMLDKQLNHEEQRQLVDEIPCGRLGLPTEIAHAAEYLCGASYVTGQVLRVNGGWYI